jgi:hypothetical protein
VGRIKGNFFLDQSIDFNFINLLLSDHDSETQNCSYEELMSFEETSTSVVERFIGDAFSQGFDSLVQGSGSHGLVFRLVFLSSRLFFFAFNGLGFLGIHSFSNDVNSSVDHNNE